MSLNRFWPGITELHVQALNYLLHVQTKDNDELEFAYGLIAYASEPSERHTLTLPEDAEVYAKTLPRYGDMQRALRQLRDIVRKTNLEREAFFSTLLKKFHGAPLDEHDKLAALYRRTENLHRLLRYISACVDESYADKRAGWYEEDVSDWGDIAESVRGLIRIKDKPFRRRRECEAARDRLGRATLHELHASNEDRKKVRWELIHDAHELLRPIQKYLDASGTNYQLTIDNLSRPEVLLSPPYPRTGLPATGAFGDLFQPFIDYLTDPAPKTALGVCSQIACEAVFSRTTRPKSLYCSTRCAR